MKPSGMWSHLKEASCSTKMKVELLSSYVISILKFVSEAEPSSFCLVTVHVQFEEGM